MFHRTLLCFMTNAKIEGLWLCRVWVQSRPNSCQTWNLPTPLIKAVQVSQAVPASKKLVLALVACLVSFLISESLLKTSISPTWLFRAPLWDDGGKKRPRVLKWCSDTSHDGWHTHPRCDHKWGSFTCLWVWVKCKFWPPVRPQGHWDLFHRKNWFFVLKMKVDACYLFLAGLGVFNVNKSDKNHFNSSDSDKAANDALGIGWLWAVFSAVIQSHDLALSFSRGCGRLMFVITTVSQEIKREKLQRDGVAGDVFGFVNF